MLDITRRQILAGSLAVAVFPMNTYAQDGSPKQGGALRMSLDSGITSLNPLKARHYQEYVMTELLYSGLTRIRPDMVVEPDLAASWSASPDLLQWTFELRPDLKFSDGTPLRAADVVASLKAVMDPKTASPAGVQFKVVSSIEAAGDLAVRIVLSTPFADLPVLLGHQCAKVVPEHIATGTLDQLNAQALGSGPFKLSSFDSDRLIVVERNPHYYDPARPYLDRIELPVYPDTTAEISALISGDTDMMSRANASDISRLTAAPGVEATHVMSGQFLNIVMRCDTEPFTDPRVRKALALTLDREQVVAYIAQNYATVGNDTPANAAYRFFSKLEQRTKNIEEAKRLLAEAGHPNGLDLTIVASQVPATRKELAIILREMAKEAGFRIEVQVVENTVFQSQIFLKGAFYIGSYFMQPTIDAIFSNVLTSDAAWNDTKWNNKKFDALIAEARRTPDEAAQAKLYADAQALAYDEVPCIVPIFLDRIGAQRTYIKGNQLHPLAAFFRMDHIWLDAGAPRRG